MTRPFAIAISIISACLVSLAANQASASDDNRFKWRSDANAGGELELSTDVGAINVTTHNKNEVVLEVDKSGKHGKDLAVTAKREGDKIIINGDLNKDSSSNYYSGKVVFNIQLPESFSVDIKTKGGGIKVQDLSGSVAAKTSGGKLAFMNINGEVSAKTSGGSIKAKKINGNAKLKTSGGSITVADVSGDLMAKTSGGSIDVEKVAGVVDVKTSGGSIEVGHASKRVEAKTSGGSINVSFVGQPEKSSTLATSAGSVNVSFADSIGFDIDAGTSISYVYSDFAIDGVTKAKGRLNGPVNGGGPGLSLKTSAGSININKM